MHLMYFFSYIYVVGDKVISKTIIKKIVLIVSIAFTFILVTLLNNPLNIEEEVIYIEEENKSVVFLLDSYNMLSRVYIDSKTSSIEEEAEYLLNVLIKSEKLESVIPSGFTPVIPEDAILEEVLYKDGHLKIYFSSLFSDSDYILEEDILESIVYTLVNIEGVRDVILYVDGEVLDRLPNTKSPIPSILDKDIGINKLYNIDNFDGVDKVTVYYVSKVGEETYYVPVTKYLNSDNSKIKIIVEELCSRNLYNTNLYSYLNNSVEVLDSYVIDKEMTIVFNDYIFNDINYEKVLEEVVYSISLSVMDTYNLESVVFMSEEKEITKMTINDLK